MKWNIALAQERRRFSRIDRRDGNNDARLRFVEKQLIEPQSRLAEINLRAERLFAGDAALCERNGETTFRAIVRAFYKPAADERAECFMNCELALKIQPRRLPNFFAMNDFKKLRAAD